MQLQGHNSGKDLPSIRNLFPNLQTIDITNAQMLNEWFESQRASIYKTRLIDMIIGDIEGFLISERIKFISKLSCEGKISLELYTDKNVPSCIIGFVFENGKVITKHRIDNVVFYKDVIIDRKNEKKTIGKSKFHTNTPISTNNFLSFNILGNFLFSPDFQEDIVKLGIAERFSHKQEFQIEKKLIITWPLWVFLLSLLSIIILIFLIIRNTILPKKLKNYVVRINENEVINIGNKKEFIISFSNTADYNLITTDKIDIKVFVSRADPLCLFIKHRLLIKVLSKNHTVTIDNKMQKMKKSYMIPLLKNIVVSENLSSVKLFFFKTDKK
jgi:hypothetical protein